ncbi:hypothetical protein G6660_02605 [Polynucleobacter paneuropaeus]|nr:hypothetical protein [Polynucleobacter paneuropaeus]
MRQGLFRAKFAQALCLIALALGVVACSPSLNWRTVQAPEEGYSTLFPAKPDKLERNLPFQDQEIHQVLQAAKIDDDIYSVSSIHLVGKQVEFLPKILEQLQTNVLSRAGVNLQNALTQESYYRNANQQRIAAKNYFLEFPSSEKNNPTHQLMRVMWVESAVENNGVWIYQLAVLRTGASKEDPKTVLTNEAFSPFFEEFKLD